MKNRMYFVRRALVKTMLSAVMYLLMPFAAVFYHKYVPDVYEGYTILGGVMLIFCNLSLIVWAWIAVFDKKVRDNYNDTIINDQEY